MAKVDFRAGAKRAKCGGVLPGARVGQVAFLVVEEAAGRDAAHEIRGSETDPGRAGGRGGGAGSRAEVLARPAADPPPTGEGRVEVVLRNGRSLWVGPGFDAGHVRALAAVLESEA